MPIIIGIFNSSLSYQFTFTSTNIKILKVTREKQQITYKGTPTVYQLTSQPKTEWHNIFKVMKMKNLQPRIFYQARLSSRFDGKNKRFTDKL